MTDFVTIEGRTLRQAMRLIMAVIERRNSIPILSHARLALNADGLKITGTDLDVEATVSIDVIDGAGEWSTCLNASTINSIACVAGVAPVRIEPSDDNATITIDDGIATYELHAIASSDFPDMGGKRGKLIETFTNGMLAETLDKVSWCISTEETRYYLNGVCWQSTPDGLRFVATDGHRLAICRYSAAEDEPSERIIPRKTVNLISKHFAGKDVAIFTTDKENVIDIAAPGMALRSKLIDGTYPKVDRVIPREDELKHAFIFKREEITTAIDQTQAINRAETGRAVRFFNDKDRVSIERKSPDFGNAKVETSAVWPNGKSERPGAFAFNGRYIREIVNACQGDITLLMIDNGSPFAITDADETMTRVIMPMRS